MLVGAAMLLFRAAVGIKAITLWRSAARTMIAMLTMAVGYAAIWNTNYVVLWLCRSRLLDHRLRAMDEWLYSIAAGHSVQFDGLFPLVRSPTLFTLLEHGYVYAFIDILVVVFALAWRDRRRAHFVGRLLLCYALALAVFTVFPVVGPCLAYPDSLRHGYEHTQTYIFQHESYREFAAIVSGHQPITGYGYFVGLPSLHTAIGVITLLAVRPYPGLFWMLVPINVTLVLSTFLLGYHYTLDTAAGLVLPSVSAAIVNSTSKIAWRLRTLRNSSDATTQ